MMLYLTKVMRKVYTLPNKFVKAFSTGQGFPGRKPGKGAAGQPHCRAAGVRLCRGRADAPRLNGEA